MKNIAVFASGSGTNFEAIVNATKQGIISCKVVLLVCDKPNALVVEKALAFGIDTFVFDPKTFNSKEAYEIKILEKLKTYNVDLVALAGYMRLIGKVLLHELSGKIINIHPSLLPKFPGKDAIGQAIDAGELETGVTVHFVDEGMDTGPIIDQVKIRINNGETKEELAKRIHAVEHVFFPKVIESVLGGLKNGD